MSFRIVKMYAARRSSAIARRSVPAVVVIDDSDDDSDYEVEDPEEFSTDDEDIIVVPRLRSFKEFVGWGQQVPRPSRRERGLRSSYPHFKRRRTGCPERMALRRMWSTAMKMSLLQMAQTRWKRLVSVVEEQERRKEWEDRVKRRKVDAEEDVRRSWKGSVVDFPSFGWPGGLWGFFRVADSVADQVNYNGENLVDLHYKYHDSLLSTNNLYTLWKAAKRKWNAFKASRVLGDDFTLANLFKRLSNLRLNFGIRAFAGESPKI